MKRKYPSRATIIAVHEDFKKHLKKEEGTGLWFYADGVTDSTMATSHGVTEATVRNLRIELFGKLREVKPPTNEVLIAKRLIELEHRVKTYEECITDLAIRLNKMEKDLYGEKAA